MTSWLLFRMFSSLRQLIIVSFLGLWQLLIGWLFSAPVKYSVDEALWEVALCALPSVPARIPTWKRCCFETALGWTTAGSLSNSVPKDPLSFSFFLPVFPFLSSRPYPFTQSIALTCACLSAHPYMTHTRVLVCLENNLKRFLNRWVFPCFLSFFKGKNAQKYTYPQHTGKIFRSEWQQLKQSL